MNSNLSERLVEGLITGKDSAKEVKMDSNESSNHNGTSEVKVKDVTEESDILYPTPTCIYE